MDVLLFSVSVGVAASLLAVGAVLFFVGGCLALSRTGVPGVRFLIPFYGPYLLFKEARSVVLYFVCLVCLAAVGVFWMMPTGFLQQFWTVPLVVGWLAYGWAVAALAECFHAGVGWQVAAFALGPYVCLLVAAGGAPFDHGCAPVVTAPFRSLEARLYERGETGPLPASDEAPVVPVLGTDDGAPPVPGQARRQAR